jgi:hypothetical protein
MMVVGCTNWGPVLDEENYEETMKSINNRSDGIRKKWKQLVGTINPEKIPNYLEI